MATTSESGILDENAEAADAVVRPSPRSEPPSVPKSASAAAEQENVAEEENAATC